MSTNSLTESVLVEVHDAAFGYGSRVVVKVDDLRLRRGQCLGIFGPNGAGKTTLIRGITGLLPPMQGRVRRPVDAAPSDSSPLHFGYLPQYRGMEMHWPMTGIDAAAMALSARRTFGWIGTGRAQILQAMKRLDVADLAQRPFARLSGGQQQRLLLAGAMASSPNVLVLDEPTDGLDVHSRENLLSLLRDYVAGGLCIVIISHEVEDLLFLAHEIAWLHASQEPGQPSHVECVPTETFAQRVLSTRSNARRPA